MSKQFATPEEAVAFWYRRTHEALAERDSLAAALTEANATIVELQHQVRHERHSTENMRIDRDGWRNIANARAAALTKTQQELREMTALVRRWRMSLEPPKRS